jgi:NAD-dependent SIR2 family protein deacetylase
VLPAQAKPGRDTAKDRDNMSSGIGPDAADETTEHAGSARGKVCCVCGKSVSGEKRFKDATGRYWCYECGQTDSMKKHPVPCPDCAQPFVKADLVEYEGAHVCASCAEKRRIAAKRAAARKAAAEEEARQQKARHRLVLIAAAVFAAAMAAYAVAKLLIWRT